MRSSILALALTLLPGLAAAQQLTKEQIAKAKEHYQAGTAAEARGAYDEAVKEFEAAYDITKDPKVFYPIAKAHESAGHLEDALIYYRRYLGEAKLSPQLEAEVKARIEVVEKKQPTEATAPPAPVEPAKEELIPPKAAAPRDEPEHPTRWYREAAWISLGVTAALLTTGGVLLTTARSREDDVNSLLETRDSSGLPHTYGGTVKEQYDQAWDEGDQLEAFALASFIGAGVTAAATVTFFILDAGSDDDAASQPSARLSPQLLPGGGAFSAAWRF
jgi:tetratricopeptide (TPR) repeat protein